jgi:hypothetical protein
MAALNRGVPHYADGTQDVPLTATQRGSLAADAQSMPYGYAGRSRGDASPTNVAPTTTAMPAAPPTGLGQLLSGFGTSASTGYAAGPANPQYVAAAQNPESSPATAMLGQFADYLSRSNRVDAVSRGPSMGARVLNFFTGKAGDTTIADHDAASQRFAIRWCSSIL